MTKPVLVEFTHPRKAALEEMMLIENNLNEVIEALEYLLRLVSGRGRELKSTQHIEIRSLFCFAAISYIRCFTAGHRRKLEISEVPTLTFVDRRLHEEIRARRNKYLAHAVDSREEGTHVFLQAPSRRNPPTEFRAWNVVLASESSATIRRFIRLVTKVRKHVRTQYDKDGRRISIDIFGSRRDWQHFNQQFTAKQGT